MRLGEVIDILKAYTVRDESRGEVRPGYDAAADAEDVLYQICDTGQNTKREKAGGVALRSIDFGHIVRLGLEETVKAHSVVEAQRDTVRAQWALDVPHLRYPVRRGI